MKNTRTLLAILPLVAIAAIAIGVGMSSNVLAQTTTPATVDQKDGPNDVADSPDQGTQTSTVDKDNVEHQDAGNDGEQKDSTESGK